MVLEIIKKIQKKHGTTVIMVTHNEKIARISDCIISLKDGQIINIEDNDAVEVSEVDW